MRTCAHFLNFFMRVNGISHNVKRMAHIDTLWQCYGRDFPEEFVPEFLWLL